jgi:hypothetical protein
MDTHATTTTAIAVITARIFHACMAGGQTVDFTTIIKALGGVMVVT